MTEIMNGKTDFVNLHLGFVSYFEFGIFPKGGSYA